MNNMKHHIDLSFIYAYDRTILQQTLDRKPIDKEALVDYVINKM